VYLNVFCPVFRASNLNQKAKAFFSRSKASLEKKLLRWKKKKKYLHQYSHKNKIENLTLIKTSFKS
jgi:hypothetical protein